MRTKALLAYGLLAGCAFGGSDDDPTREIEFDSGTLELDSAVQLDADIVSDSAITGDGNGDTEPDAAPHESCAAPVTVNVCDPIHNTGCLLTQCDIDTEAATAAGRCVFSQPALGTTCASDALSETCPAMSTCLAGECRKMCWCSADCDVGECCRDAPSLGPGVFRLCEPC